MTIQTESDIYCVLKKDNKYFCEFEENDGMLLSETLDDNVWTEYNDERLQDMIWEYERLKDFKICKIRITKTVSIEEV